MSAASGMGIGPPATSSTTASSIATPSGSGGFLATLFAGPTALALAARLGAWLAALWGDPIRFGSKVIVARHAHVSELLARDLEFRIAPVNGARIEAVNGPFVLGMDRCATLAHERRALYQALALVDLGPIRRSVAQQASAR